MFVTGIRYTRVDRNGIANVFNAGGKRSLILGWLRSNFGKLCKLSRKITGTERRCTIKEYIFAENVQNKMFRDIKLLARTERNFERKEGGGRKGKKEEERKKNHPSLEARQERALEAVKRRKKQDSICLHFVRAS